MSTPRSKKKAPAGTPETKAATPVRAVKARTGFMIASNEIPTNRRVDFDTTVAAMALTAKKMNSKYKKTLEGGLAVSLTLC